MNKKTIIKICFSLISFLALIFSVFSVIDAIKQLSFYQDRISDAYVLQYQIDFSHFRRFEIHRLCFWVFCCISNFLFFLVINFKDLKFLTESIIEKFVSWRKDTEEERKENKQAKLQREIAEKQAELEKMKNDTKTE